jgi:thioredoxin 2
VIRKCSKCGQKNRIPPAHLHDRGRCGACKADIEPLAKPVGVGVTEFDAIVSEARAPVLVDFWAAWCGPCRMVAPEVERLAEVMAGKAIVLKVDTEKHPELAARYQVRGIPNFIVLSGGKLVFQQAGAVDHRRMMGWLEDARAA